MIESTKEKLGPEENGSSLQKDIFWNYYLIDSKIIHKRLAVVLVGSWHLSYECAFLWIEKSDPYAYIKSNTEFDQSAPSDDENVWGPGGEDGEFDEDYYREKERNKWERLEKEEREKSDQEDANASHFIEQATLFGIPLTFAQAISFGLKVDQATYCESMRIDTYYDIGWNKDYVDWQNKEEAEFPVEFNEAVRYLCGQKLKPSEAIELFLEYGVICLTWNTWISRPCLPSHPEDIFICHIGGLPRTSELDDPTLRNFVQNINLKKLADVFLIVEQKKKGEKEEENKQEVYDESARPDKNGIIFANEDDPIDDEDDIPSFYSASGFNSVSDDDEILEEDDFDSFDSVSDDDDTPEEFGGESDPYSSDFASGEVLEIDQENIIVLNNKGDALIELGKYQEALEVFEEALKIDPENIVALTNKGHALFNLGKYQEALEVFEEALKIDPENAITLNNKGATLSSLGKYQEALEVLEEALKIDPEYIAVSNNKKIALDGLGMKKEESWEGEELKDASFRLNKEKEEAVETILSSKNTLVTARAGSGKTTLLLHLIKKLTGEYGVSKNEILLLSFGKKITEQNIIDLSQKHSIDDYYGAQTFHGLGHQIAKPDRTKIIEDQHDDQKIIKILVDLVKKEATWKFKLKCWWYLGELEKESGNQDTYTSLLGEVVKSYGEKLVADFLFENGIDYEYEPTFDWGGFQYRPDFQIKQENNTAIIEYFGISETKYDKTDPSQMKYVSQIASKRKYWSGRENFIEMSIDDFKGASSDDHKLDFLEVIKKRIEDFSFILRSLSEEEKAEKAFHARFKKITKHILNFIKFARARCLTPEDIASLLEKTDGLPKKDKFFSELANEVYEKYIDYLEENGLFDFPKMIEKAAKIVGDSRGNCGMSLGPNKDVEILLPNIKWVLVDEFQDISPISYSLLNTIQQTNKGVRFVCVGDDWQAINGFAGSDTEYMLNFQKYFPDSTRANLLTNFRSASKIVEAGNRLMRGYGEDAVPNRKDEGVFKIYRLPPANNSEERLILYDLYFEKIKEIIEGIPKNKKITILNRTNKIFGRGRELFSRQVYKMSKREVSVSTMHKYKGKEDDVIIIINATKWNHPLMHPERTQKVVLGLNDERILLEERRLFYVAITRAKDELHIITESGNESPFIKDIETNYG